ncbi:hypothetical protein SH661x_002901 [Planctomicrobium sp. SH661]|uniref:hypothetical protein n=1 Tax=Planctomicrobium sp. SH661 TaxID=3448124 RepID=UPI003F5BEB06
MSRSCSRLAGLCQGLPELRNRRADQNRRDRAERFLYRYLGFWMVICLALAVLVDAWVLIAWPLLAWSLLSFVQALCSNPSDDSRGPR